MMRLKEKDLKEGQQLADIITNLPEAEKRQAIIYVGALADRTMMINKIQKSGDENKCDHSPIF